MMKSAVLAAITVFAIAGPASAGVYVGLGVGIKPVVNNAMETAGAPSGRNLRGLVGLRLANVSLEGAVNGFDVVTERSGNQKVYQASLALKLSIPLVAHLECFTRAGVERTWLNLDDDRYNLQGDGFMAGGGVELRFNALIASMSVFADYTLHHANLDSTLDTVNSTSQVVSVGVTVGL